VVRFPEYGINYANIAEISNMPNAKVIYKIALTKNIGFNSLQGKNSN
jgi:hypothetical protein